MVSAPKTTHASIKRDIGQPLVVGARRHAMKSMLLRCCVVAAVRLVQCEAPRLAALGQFAAQSGDSSDEQIGVNRLGEMQLKPCL